MPCVYLVPKTSRIDRDFLQIFFHWIVSAQMVINTFFKLLLMLGSLETSWVILPFLFTQTSATSCTKLNLTTSFQSKLQLSLYFLFLQNCNISQVWFFSSFIYCHLAGDWLTLLDFSSYISFNLFNTSSNVYIYVGIWEIFINIRGEIILFRFPSLFTRHFHHIDTVKKKEEKNKFLHSGLSWIFT